jgi:hypothetical protein
LIVLNPKKIGPAWKDAAGRIREKDQGTDQENRDIVAGSIANFGSYHVESNAASPTLVLQIEDASYPNWRRTISRRKIVDLDQNNLIYEVSPASHGGVATFHWTRVK